MLESIAIVLSLSLLMVMAYRGYSVIFFAPIFAVLAGLLSGLSPLPTYTELFLPQMASYVKIYFPFFLLGAVFGKVMEQSGAAESIAQSITKKVGGKNTILAVVLACAVLTYGGVSLFVVAFAVYPFAASLFREAGIPRRLLPPTIALGAFTFTMDALPGTPQIQNSIPMKYFNTDLYAAPVFGSVGAVLILTGGLLYLELKRRKALAKGEPYDLAEVAQVRSQLPADELPAPFLAALPLLLVFLMTLGLQKVVIPRLDISDWATAAPYKMDGATLKGTMNNWALIVALASGILLAFLLNTRRLSGKMASAISLGSAGALLAVMNTASEVGFGNVIKILPGFRHIADALMGSKQGGGLLFTEALTVNILSGVTGSASGGLSIALDTFGKDFLSWAQSSGISPELLHRVGSMASGGMDTLPHNGAVITLLAITGLTHRQSYLDIFTITLIKTSVVFILIGLWSVF